jgi:hypothetical protein
MNEPINERNDSWSEADRQPAMTVGQLIERLASEDRSHPVLLVGDEHSHPTGDPARNIAGLTRVVVMETGEVLLCSGEDA